MTGNILTGVIFCTSFVYLRMYLFHRGEFNWIATYYSYTRMNALPPHQIKVKSQLSKESKHRSLFINTFISLT